MKNLLSLLLTVASAYGQSSQYTYDNLYRLTSVQYSNGNSVKYFYDANGNRTQEVYNDTYTVCPGNNIVYNANAVNTSTYQWQADDGNGYVNVSDNSTYNGSNGSTLTLVAPPTNWYGRKYRCLINGNAGEEYILKFVINWLGTSNTVWNNPLNWSCGNLPDENTDVIIPSSLIRYPVVSETAKVRSLTLQGNAALHVNTGLEIKK